MQHVFLKKTLTMWYNYVNKILVSQRILMGKSRIGMLEK